MIRATIAIAAAAITAASSAALAGSATAPTLKGTVGPGFTITLTKSGKRVKTLPVGRYIFVIADKAAVHNFTLERESGGTFEKQLTTSPSSAPSASP